MAAVTICSDFGPRKIKSDTVSTVSPSAGNNWRQKEKGMTKDEMVGWHHRLRGHEFEWTPGVGDGQGALPCCSSWGCKESDTTEWLNWCSLQNVSSLTRAWTQALRAVKAQKSNHWFIREFPGWFMYNIIQMSNALLALTLYLAKLVSWPCLAAQ